MGLKRYTPNPFSKGLSALAPADVSARFRQSYQVANAPPAPTDPVALNNPLIPTLAQQAAEQELFFKSYSGRSLSEPNTPAYAARAPWIEMPAGGQPFLPQGYIDTPAANGLDTVVQTLVVPPGWDGVITKIANFYTGGGLVIGSGKMIWRIERNGQAIKGFDAIQACLGAFGAAGINFMDLASMPIRIFSGETITYVVNHAVASPLPVAGTSIATLLGGYFYSRP